MPPPAVKLPYLYRQMRRGRVRYRFEKPGHPRKWLTAEPGTPEFLAEYRECLTGEIKKPKAEPPARKVGTFAWLAYQYSRSAEWAALADSTRKQRASFYDRIIRQVPDVIAADLDRATVRRLRDARQKTPGAARNMMKALSALYRWGVEAELVPVNPVEGVKRPAQSREGFRPWSVDDVNRFREKYGEGTREHLAMCLLLFTACRRADLVTLGVRNVRDGWICWQQGKTGETVEVPILPPLADAIRLAGAGPVFLRTEYGEPFSVAGFGNWWRDRVRASGIDAAPSHGLRKAAGGLLAEFGCTEHEIMAVLGHSDPGTARIYTKSASRRMMAQSAMKKMGGFKW